MSPPRLRSTRQRQLRQSEGNGEIPSSRGSNEASSYPKTAIRGTKRRKQRPASTEEKNEVAWGRSSQKSLDISDQVTPSLQRKLKHHNKTVAAPQFISFDSTSELLVHLSTRIIDLMNERNYTSPLLSCLDHDIETPGNSGRSNVIEGFKLMAEALPDYHNKVQNVTCTVNEDTGMAKVVMTMRVSGFVYGIVRQSSSLFTWMRRGDRWSCARYTVLRGIEEFD